MELAVHHNHYESHHASGPQDNAGKDPRKAMDAAIQHKKAGTIYDYHTRVHQMQHAKTGLLSCVIKVASQISKCFISKL